jgi:hypothetical protein
MKYVCHELFDERTSNIEKCMNEIKLELVVLNKRVIELNQWKLKVITAASVVSGLITATFAIIEVVIRH